MILYNQRNWRDILSEKPKGVTREEYELLRKECINQNVTAYRINRAKKNLRKFNDLYRGGITEVNEEKHMQDPATQIHHIFPASDYPEIADYLENLIALTPTQHLAYAHPNNKTQYVDKKYQYLCLIAKTGNIQDNLLEKYNNPIIYDFNLFQTVLCQGFHTDEFYRIKFMDFGGILNCIEKNYEL